MTLQRDLYAVPCLWAVERPSTAVGWADRQRQRLLLWSNKNMPLNIILMVINTLIKHGIL